MPAEKGPGAERHGIAITGHGVRFDLDWNAPATARSDGKAEDAFATAIAAVPEMETVAVASVSRLQLTGARTRGTDGDGALTVELGDTRADEQRVVLIEENGSYTWSIPARGESNVRLPVEAVPGTRGYLPKAVRRVIRVIAVKTAGRVAASVAGKWDARKHPYLLRSWTSGNHRSSDAGSFDLTSWRATTDPALLLIHGFTGSTHSSFAFADSVVAGLYEAYGGRTIAFDHPTLAASPADNVKWLLEQSPLKKLTHQLPVDVLAYSRGGLVARELAASTQTNSLLRVRSITFVATPNAGTPLCDPDRPSGLLDALTNLAGALIGSPLVELVLELVQEVATAAVLDGLHGLAAMNPADARLKTLNSTEPDGIELRAICADYEPPTDAGIVRTARDRAVDLYFGGIRNDLIVPTLSTIVTDGPFRVRPENRLVLDSSRAVDHSSFWTDQRTVHQLRAWLRADWPINVPAAVPSEESDPLAETALPPDPLSIGRVIKAATGIPARLRKAAEELVGGPLDSEAIPPTDERDAVVVVPGIMGTHLARPDGTVVWLDPLRLARGHFADMALPGKETAAFTPAGLNRCYLPLVLRLAKTHDVYVAPYDWRLDIKESACALGRMVETVLDRNPNRVHLVAHSMGGLVARAMVSFEDEVWKAMAAANRPAGSGRLVMLGTPHHGSFSIVLTLLGQETVLKVLAGVDGFNSSEELSAVVATFPGIYQMLPHTTAHCDGDDHKDLFDAATWGARSPVSQDLLTKAEEFHARLARARDPKRMVCVAGYGNATPYRVTVREPGRFSLGVSSRGDGRVAERLARLEGVKTYYTPASHGGLPSAKDVLGVLDDLLELGRTTGLPDSPPSVRGVDALATPPLVPAELFDEIHAADALRDGAGSEGAPPDWRAAEARLEEGLAFLVGGGRRRPSKVQIEVRVKHASLEQAEFPVAVGHYAGLPQGGAERFLDTRLAGALRARQIVGQYPEGPGAAIYIAAPEGHRPRGAIVLGLGSFGQLTPGTLAEAMCNGVVAYALADREIRDPSVGQEWSIGVSSVLVSTPGRHGLSVESSVAGLVEGVVTAAGRLRKLNSGPRLERVILEVVELYEEPAEDAALAVVALPDLLDPRVLQEADVLAATRLATGDGRRAGSPPKDLTGTPWVPIRIEMDEPRGPSRGIRRMRFSPLARRAQANAIEHDVNTTMIQAFIEEAIHRADVNHDFSRTLYHHLFPHRAKLDFDRAEALHLLVDEDVADIPWELLATESAGGCVSPLALRSGLLRQLVSSRQTRERWRQPSGQLALIVGDPPTALDRLPGAREEAHELTSLFHQYDWTVEPLIYGPSDDGSRGEWMDILNRLYANSYRIVHIAAHGVFDDDPRRAGVQIGLGDDHRITPLCFDDMMVTPDLVFLNCCHLAQMAPGNTAPGLDRPNQLAATVARQLLENGVPAVVVAGWAVDDVAARAFASKLYRSMLDGVPFGDAVRRARIAARDADRGATTTWGAYQCYGDPDFQFFAHDPPEPVPRIVSASQLARQLDMAAARAGNAMTDVHKARVLQEVQDLVQHAGVDLLTDGAVLEALGHAYAELGEHRSAIDAYRRSLNDEGGASRVRAAARLANCQVRLATHLHHDGNRAGRREAAELFSEARQTLGWLERLCNKTAEIHAIRGSLEKKRATTRNGPARTKALERAREEYLAAWTISSEGKDKLDAYHTNLWLQLAFITNGRLTRKEKALLGRLVTQVEDKATRAGAGYWDHARLADTIVTQAVITRCNVMTAKEEYLKGFRLRSTARQRESAMDHLLDLSRLLPDGQAYASLVEELRREAASGA